MMRNRRSSTWFVVGLGILVGRSAIAQVASPAPTEGVVTMQETPDVYVIQPGDTLWDISRRFLGNPDYWPKLWSINDYITNPHWIYPGNKVVFRMGTLVEPPQVQLEAPTTTPSRQGYVAQTVQYTEEVEAECGPLKRFNTEAGAETFLAPGFVAPKADVQVYGTVAHARTSQTWLAERDRVYLKLNDPDEFNCGDVVLIFRRQQKNIRDPNQHRTQFGDLYRIVGEAKITHRYGDYDEAIVTTSYSEIYRGDLVGPVMPTAVEVEVKPPKGELTGTIVARLTEEATLPAVRETVFINRGRADGVRVGSSFYVIEHRDKHDNLDKSDPDLPPTIIGRIVVVRVDEYSSTAVVTDAAEPINVGDELAMSLK